MFKRRRLEKENEELHSQVLDTQELWGSLKSSARTFPTWAPASCRQHEAVCINAAKHPHAVKRLLLGSIGTRPNQKMIETIQRGRALDLKDRAQIADLIIDSFGQKLPEPVKKRIAVQFRSISKENLQSFCDHGLNVISVQKFSDHIDLKKVSVETVLIRGEEDTIVDLEDVMFLSSQIPNSQLRIIKNVGHFLHMESEAVFDVYRELLSNTVSTINDYVACEG